VHVSTLNPPRATALPSRARTVILAAAGLAWALWVDAPKLGTFGGIDLTLWGDLIAGLLMQWVGLLVWGKRGTGFTGPLVYLSGLLWFVGSGLPEPLDFLTFAWRGWYQPALVAVVLGYWAGRLAPGIDRLLVGAMVVTFLVRSLVRQFGFDPHAYFHVDGVNPTLIVWNEGLWTAVEIATGVVVGVVGVALVIRSLARWWAASPPARRTLTPMVVAGIAIAPLLGWTTLTTPSNAFELPIGVDPYWIVWATLILWPFVPIAIAIGLMRIQQARTSVADVLVELDRGVPVARLEDVLQRRLSDPSLRILFVGGDGRAVDASGGAVETPKATPTTAVTQVDSETGRPIAYIVHDPALDEDPSLLQAISAATRLSLENDRLQAEVRAQLTEVRELSARLVDASDAERRRMERDLHDGAQQRLVTLALRLQVAGSSADAQDGDLERLLTEATAELDGALAELRELARGIHPEILTRSGLAAAVTVLAERSPIPVVTDVMDGRCAAASEVTAYYVIAEALTNVTRHAGATSAKVHATLTDGRLMVEIADDGVGGATLHAGTGLAGLRDRVVAVGGAFEVQSEPGSGTSIRATLPCG
jgi:signal transduction histidine kinase